MFSIMLSVNSVLASGNTSIHPNSEGEKIATIGTNIEGEESPKAFVLIGTAFYNSPSPPTITSFTPLSGPVGTLVTITGTNLEMPTSLLIGGADAIPISNDGGTLVAMLMPGAMTGTVDISTSGGTATSTDNFTIEASVPPKAQQGDKLVGTGNTGPALQGRSVSLSADGNTALVGGYGDNTGQGAAWVFIRTGSTWTQQGTKLVGTGNGGAAQQGISVSLSADGHTALVGGYADNGWQGAAWIFTRTDSTWSQQGEKLTGTGIEGAARRGKSVSISADGNTAMIGGPYDNSSLGAVWIFTRTDSTWAQQGEKLVGTGSVGDADGRVYQGVSVSISADGTTALVGGEYDNAKAGAV